MTCGTFCKECHTTCGTFHKECHMTCGTFRRECHTICGTLCKCAIIDHTVLCRIDYSQMDTIKMNYLTDDK